MAGGRAHTSGAIAVSGTSRTGMRSQIVSSPVTQKGPGWTSPLNPRRAPQAVGAAFAAVGLAISSLVDDFSDNFTDPALWPNSFGGFSEVGGRARVTCDAGFNAYSSALTYTLAESSVYLRVYPPAAGGATTEAWTQILVKQQTNGTDLGFEISPLSGNLTMFSRVGFFDAGAVVITYSATDHAWLRIRETGGTVYWDTSPDSLTWTNRRTLASPVWVSDPNLEFQLIAHRDSGTNDYAEFDNVNVSTGQSAVLGTATETDSGQALTSRKTRTLNTASATETAQTLPRAKTRALGIASETDAAQAVGRAKRRTLASAAETDTAGTVGRIKTRAAAIVQESDSAQSLARRKNRATAPAASTETAQALTRRKARALGAAVEADTAQVLTAPGRLTAAQETATARPFAAVKRRTVAMAAETGQALALGRRKALALAPAQEVSAALGIGHGQTAVDIDIIVGMPYSPWSAGAPKGEPWPAGEPQASDWEVAVPW